MQRQQTERHKGYKRSIRSERTYRQNTSIAWGMREEFPRVGTS